MTLSNRELYEKDFFAWTKDTARLLDKGLLEEVDIPHLIEEIEDMGKRDKRAIRSRLSNIMAHLLKYSFISEKRLRTALSWKGAIVDNRLKINDIIEDSPTLANISQEDFNKAYNDARKKAVAETGLPAEQFPKSCPFTMQQCLSIDYFPVPQAV